MGSLRRAFFIGQVVSGCVPGETVSVVWAVERGGETENKGVATPPLGKMTL
jgi:hypothetical protein